VPPMFRLWTGRLNMNMLRTAISMIGISSAGCSRRFNHALTRSVLGNDSGRPD